MSDETALPEAPDIPDVPEDLESTEPFDDTNAAVMAEIISDPVTSEFVKLQILNALLAAESGQTFFQTIIKEDMTFCECPNCGHQNHWLVPEDDLNQMGWVTAHQDERVKKHTTQADCKKYAEACGKKKVSG
jgi:hypothetical protein